MFYINFIKRLPADSVDARDAGTEVAQRYQDTALWLLNTAARRESNFRYV